MKKFHITEKKFDEIGLKPEDIKNLDDIKKTFHLHLRQT